MAASTTDPRAVTNGSRDGDHEAPAVCAGLPCPDATLSPWLREPSKQLFGLQSTAELPKSADVIVVGSGITGAFAAHFLKADRARGQSVVMLEAREACWGATARNTGIFEPRLFANTNEGAAFEAENYRLVRDIVRVAGIECDWVANTCLCINREPLTTFGEVLAKEIRERFPALGELMDSKRFAPKGSERNPAAGGEEDDEKRLVDAITERLRRMGVEDGEGCVILPNAALINPYKMVTWLLERLVDQFPVDEFALHTNTPVTALTPGGGEAHGGSNGSGWTLTTPRGQIWAPKVLLATNGYTTALLPAFADLISPVKGQGRVLVPKTAPNGGGSGIDLKQCAYYFASPDGKHEETLIQRPRTSAGGGGELLVGGARHLCADFGVGNSRDDTTDAEVTKYLQDLMQRIVDGGGEAAAKEFGAGSGATAQDWTGIMGWSRDRMPWIGRVPESHGGGKAGGLYLCAAYTGRGLTLAPLCAKWVVHDMMMTTAAADGEEGGAAASSEGAAAEGLHYDADDTPMSRMPECYRIDFPGRLDMAEDWPDVATVEEGGILMVLQHVVSNIMSKGIGYEQYYEKAPRTLTVHETLRKSREAREALIGAQA